MADRKIAVVRAPKPAGGGTLSDRFAQVRSNAVSAVKNRKSGSGGPAQALSSMPRRTAALDARRAMSRNAQIKARRNVPAANGGSFAKGAGNKGGQRRKPNAANQVGPVTGGTRKLAPKHKKIKGSQMTQRPGAKASKGGVNTHTQKRRQQQKQASTAPKNNSNGVTGKQQKRKNPKKQQKPKQEKQPVSREDLDFEMDKYMHAAGRAPDPVQAKLDREMDQYKQQAEPKSESS